MLEPMPTGIPDSFFLRSGGSLLPVNAFAKSIYPAERGVIRTFYVRTFNHEESSRSRRAKVSK